MLNIESYPQFISLHIRHGDFGNGCETTEGCFAPLSLYADRVADVKNEIYRKHGLRIPSSHVIVMSGMYTRPFLS